MKQSDRRDGLIIAILVIAAVVITFVFFPLRIQAQDSPHARYHADFYSRWYRADGNSCCSNQDCRPLLLEFGINGSKCLSTEHGLPCLPRPSGRTWRPTWKITYAP